MNNLTFIIIPIPYATRNRSFNPTQHPQNPTHPPPESSAPSSSSTSNPWPRSRNPQTRAAAATQQHHPYHPPPKTAQLSYLCLCGPGAGLGLISRLAVRARPSSARRPSYRGRAFRLGWRGSAGLCRCFRGGGSGLSRRPSVTLPSSQTLRRGQRGGNILCVSLC